MLYHWQCLPCVFVQLANQTSQPAPQNTMSHRDIARHQSSSTVFSWQERTPGRPSSSSHDNSLKRNYTSIQYPWEQEETPSKRGLKSDGLNRSFCESSNNPANDQLRIQNQGDRQVIVLEESEIIAVWYKPSNVFQPVALQPLHNYHSQHSPTAGAHDRSCSLVTAGVLQVWEHLLWRLY